MDGFTNSIPNTDHDVMDNSIICGNSRHLLDSNITDKKHAISVASKHKACDIINGDDRRVKPRFEAYMMTGELILNLSKTSTDDKIISSKCIESIKDTSSSVPSSPNESQFGFRPKGTTKKTKDGLRSPGSESRCNQFNYPNSSCVRTSKSEDQLQFQKGSLTAVDIDIDDDVTSSLNTLLDTRNDGVGENDRIVWTYNAPVSPDSLQSFDPNTSGESSPLKTPSSVSPLPSSPSSKSQSNKSDNPCNEILLHNSDSTISSPDFKDEIWSLQSEPQNSIGISDKTQTVGNLSDKQVHFESLDDNKIVIRVKGLNNVSESQNLRLSVTSSFTSTGTPCSPMSSSANSPEGPGYLELRESEDEVTELVDDEGSLKVTKSSPPISESDDSDVESLHSFHYSPKAVDIPSAKRLAKRLYNLDGFKKSDVSRHLCKNNDFSRVVAEEYLNYFDFTNDTLDAALGKFLGKFNLQGETQERERVLVHFSKKYLDCNPGSFNSQDAVHTLTCAIMLLNTDLHGQNTSHRMTCVEFIANLVELNDGEDYPRNVLKEIYTSVKNNPLQWAIDENTTEDRNLINSSHIGDEETSSHYIGHNPFLDVPTFSSAKEYKKGYVMRKCCIDPNGKRTPFGKRRWKMFYCVLRDLVLYLYKDEHGSKRSQVECLHNSVRVHHSLATRASDYTKKQHVFRLQTADQAEYLFQTSDNKELQSWIETVNFVSGSLSAPPLPGAVGSQKKFQRPLLPSSMTRLNFREQLLHLEEKVNTLEKEIVSHKTQTPENSKALVWQNYKEKEVYLQFELNRIKTYTYLMKSKLVQYPELEPPIVETSIGEVDERSELEENLDSIIPPPIPERSSKPSVTNRYSYRAAIYNSRIEGWA